jgi:hypothetical protein
MALRKRHGFIEAREKYYAQRGTEINAPPKVEKFGTAFAIGDKVMQIENDYMIVVKPRCRMLLKLNAIEQK